MGRAPRLSVSYSRPGDDEAAMAIPHRGAVVRSDGCDTSPVLFDQYGVAFLLAIVSGALAFVINASWPVHNCGNRYCHHLAREDEFDEPDLS